MAARWWPRGAESWGVAGGILASCWPLAGLLPPWFSAAAAFLLPADGEVRHFDLREPGGGARRLLACRSGRGRLELNSVHCRPGSTQFCVAGGDPFVRCAWGLAWSGTAWLGLGHAGRQ